MLMLLRQRTKTSGWRLTVPDQIFYVTRDSIFFFLSVVDSSINVQKRATKVVERLRCYFKRDVNRDTIPPLSYTPKTFTAVWLYRRRWSPLLFDCHQENGQGNTFGATLKGGKTQMFRVVQQPAYGRLSRHLTFLHDYWLARCYCCWWTRQPPHPKDVPEGDLVQLVKTLIN